MFGFHKDKEVANASTLSDIARGLQHVVNTTHEILEHHFIRMISKYFGEDGSAVTRRIRISDSEVIDVPLITLVQPLGMAMEELEVRLSVRVDKAIVKTRKAVDDDQEVTRASFQVSLAPTSEKDEKRPPNVIDIIMKFKGKDTPEGVSRIVDEFTSKVLAKDVGPQE